MNGPSSLYYRSISSMEYSCGMELNLCQVLFTVNDESGQLNFDTDFGQNLKYQCHKTTLDPRIIIIVVALYGEQAMLHKNQEIFVIKVFS